MSRHHIASPFRFSIHLAPLVIAAAVCLLAGACQGFGQEEPVGLALPSNPTWVDGVGELFDHYCNSCHGPGADSSLGALRTDIYEDSGQIAGAYSKRYRHLARVLDGSRPMPPAPAPPLTPSEVAALQNWIDSGAPYDSAGLVEGTSLGTSSCSPGVASPCACAGGFYGTQSCEPQGTYGPCDCGTGSPGPNGGDIALPEGDPVLDDVVTLILAPSCATSGCHEPTGAFPDLWTSGGLRSRLLGPPIQSPGMNLVEPGNVDASYLLVKSRSNFSSLGVGGGAVMPPPGYTPLSGNQIRLFEDWILSGAR